MPKDDPRQAALWFFEQLKKQLQRIGDPDTDYYEQAVFALRRSQDHTAIQTKLNAAMRYLRRFADGQSVEMNQLKEFIGEPYTTVANRGTVKP